MKEKNLEIVILLDFYGDLLTEKQKELLDMYYNGDLSLSEIAEHEGISRQGVRDSIKRGEVTLVQMEDKLGFAKRFYEIEQSVSEIIKTTEQLADMNKRHFFSRDMAKRLEYICDCAKRIADNGSEE